MIELRGLELSESNVEELFDMLGNDETRWYALRRLRGFTTAGLVAGTLWNPDLHPRGPDGKFIEQWGFIRWLVDGMWERGQVENILPDGELIVKPDSDPGSPTILKVNQAYSLPTPKGHIAGSPDPNAAGEQPNWEKTGKQSGSNPGGFYTSTADTIRVRPTPSPEMIEQVVAKSNTFDEGYFYKDMEKVFQAVGTDKPDLFVGLYTDPSGQKKMIFQTGPQIGGYGVLPEVVEEADWKEAKASSDLKLWVTTSPQDAEAVKLQLTHGMDVEKGTQFYVKQTKSANHGANEMLANELYKLAGVPVPDLFFGNHQTVASKILKSSDPDTPAQMLSAVQDDPLVRAQIRQNMAVDAWLANWDVAGLTYDNIIVVDGIPYRIDTGGSLEYRAQGGAKGPHFGNTVGELETFLNSGMNPSSSKIFAGISQAELRAGASKVGAISPKRIKEMVGSAGMSSSVADTLIARRADLLEKTGLPDPFVTYVPPSLTKVAKLQPSDEQFWNPLDNQWQPGVLANNGAVLHNQMSQEIGHLYDSADPDVMPLVGDTFVAVVPGEGAQGFFRATYIDGDTVIGVSALDPDNTDEYEFNTKFIRAAIKSEKLDQLHLQYRVAAVNEQIKLSDLQGLFNLALKNEQVTKPPLFIRPYSTMALGDALWKLDAGDFVFNVYDDDEGDHQVVYQIKGIEGNTISMFNVVDGKETILTYDDWVDNYAPSQWHIPDEYTQDQTLALLQRDAIIDKEDVVGAVELTVPLEDDVDVSSDYPEVTAHGTTPVDLTALGVTPSMSGVTGVNNNLTIGEAVPMSYLHPLLVEHFGGEEGTKALEDGVFDDTPVHEWLGQSVIISTANPKEQQPYNIHDRRGLWFVEEVIVKKSSSYYGDPVLEINMKLRAPSGPALNMVLRGDDKVGDQLIQPVTSIDASIPQVPPQFKVNGDVVMEGNIIGTWSKSWSSFSAQIFPEYSINGVQKTLSYGKKKDLAKMLGIYAIPQLVPVSVDKSEKTKGSKAAILTYPSLKTNKDFAAGSWVQAPDGFSGVVGVKDSGIGSEPTFLSRFPSAVRVTGTDGKTRIINANLLVSIDKPAEPEEAPAFTPEPPPLTTAEVSTITGKPPYFPLKYGDGNDPMVGQKVKAGKGKKEIEGVVVWITPPGGKQASIKPYADVMTPDGKKTKKSLSMITVIEGAPTTPTTGLPDDTKAAAEIVADFTPYQISDLALKYVMPDGHTLAQPQWEKDQWLAGSPKRKLTKDGYAPRVGMRMRTNQDEPVVVVSLGDPYKSPNYVRVVNLGDGKEQSKPVSALWVDHPAEIGSADGTSLDYIRGITVTHPDSAVPPVEKLPNGTVIYKATGDSQVNVGGIYRHIDSYFFITESGQLQSLGGGQALHATGSKNQLAKLAATGKLEKVAIVDEAAASYAAYADFNGKNPTALVLYNPGEFSHEEALSGHFLELTSQPVKGSELAVPIPKDSLGVNLPKPAEAIDVTNEEMLPDPPQVTGVVGEIDEVPRSIPVRSVTDAGLEIVSQRESKDAGSGTEYAFGDAEYIEDMQVRSQIARDTGTEDVFVEFHFRMPEEKAEAVADKLLIAGKDTKYGKWEARPEPVRASELQIGDAISVRTSSMSDALKPSNGTEPNVRVVADPVLLGTDSKGTPIYRVTIAAADGTTGAMDVQERALPSMKVYDWNPAAIASVSTSTQVHLSSKAITAGWIEVSNMGYDHNPTAGTISMDETGAKLINGNAVNRGGNSGSTALTIATQISQRHLHSDERGSLFSGRYVNGR